MLRLQQLSTQRVKRSCLQSLPQRLQPMQNLLQLPHVLMHLMQQLRL